MDKLQHFPDCSCTGNINHPSQAQSGIHVFPGKLYVVTMLSNPLRYRNRYSNYWRFENQVNAAGAELYTVELAFGERHFEITEPNNPKHLQLRTSHELWHKENALNLLIQRLPTDAKYVAWIDADVMFTRGDWAQETLHLLQHYDVLQMFSQAMDLDVNNEPTQQHTGFMFEYSNAQSDPLNTDPIKLYPDTKGQSGSGGGSGYKPYGKGYWHPGFAWAAKKEALNKVGMLMDWPILGSADWHMAWALIGRAQYQMNPALSENYKNLTMEWQNRAEMYIKRNVGYMPGLITHMFHGSKAKRAYGDRWSFLINAKFDPITDIKRDHQGLWQLSNTNVRLRDGIRVYNRQRHEDENTGIYVP